MGTKTINTNLLAVVDPPPVHDSEINWTFLYPEDPAQTQAAVEEKEVTYDRLLKIALGAINHELRTPLALIFQVLEMLEDPRLGSMTEEQLDALMVLRRQAQTLGQMIDGLLYIATFTDQQKTIRPVLARMGPVLDKVLCLAEFKARSKELVVETAIAPNLPLVPIDIKQIEEALDQLLDNAIKFTGTGGKIRLTAHADSYWIILTVADTGIGIEAGLLHKIWDVFEQSADPLRRAQEGLGVGLSVARYIIEAHGGTIEVDSTLGQGSIFTVKLPRTKRVY